jgi:hypothetical protein
MENTMQENQPLQKPRTVDIAVKLIVIGVVASFVLTIFWAIVDYSEFHPRLERTGLSRA